MKCHNKENCIKTFDNINKVLGIYLTGTLVQMWIVCMVVMILRRQGVVIDYTNVAGFIAIAVGGTSSAIWGCIVTVKYSNKKLIDIFKDFFNVKQRVSFYLLLLLFILLDFGYVFINGNLQMTAWYTPFILFVKAIVFGGIEEIGWRYTFQPELEKKVNYVLATFLTFIMWGIWHFSYFYVEGTLPQIEIIGFTVGLLVNCFILSALFNKTNSLWLCVMAHALINVFSQIVTGGNQYVSYVCKVIIIVIAIYVSRNSRGRKNTPRNSKKLQRGVEKACK